MDYFEKKSLMAEVDAKIDKKTSPATGCIVILLTWVVGFGAVKQWEFNRKTQKRIEQLELTSTNTPTVPPPAIE